MSALKDKDRQARDFIDGVIESPVCMGNVPPELTPENSAALWLMEKGARAIKDAEEKVICIKAGNELATDIAKARWRKENGAIVAETGFFAHTFTAFSGGWSLEKCKMLPTARVGLRSYLRIFGDFTHSPARGDLPDFYLRDLTAEEIKENGLREGAVLSVSATVMKKMGRICKHKKREKKMRAKMDEWRERGGSFSGKPKPKRAKNALVIKEGEKEGEGWNRTNMFNPVHTD